MRILLHDNQLCERGTTTSMVAYGRALRTRGHEVELSYWSDSPANVPAIVRELEMEFTLHPHVDQFRIPDSLAGFDSAYFIKAGDSDGLLLPDAHNLVHVVFQNYEPHGSRYVYISEWLATEMRQRVHAKNPLAENLYLQGLRAQDKGCIDALRLDYLNLIVDVPMPQEGIRHELAIPDDAFVILRFGAYDSFDIPWVQDVVTRQLDKHPHWHFIGLNTARFTAHPRAHFLPMVLDPVEKASIIAASDVFLTARGQGEAFGVAIAEALQVGVPVLAWRGGADQAHVDMLQGLGGIFSRSWDLTWRLHRIARGKDPSSIKQRQERGDSFRPVRVVPKLEELLTPS